MKKRLFGFFALLLLVPTVLLATACSGNVNVEGQKYALESLVLKQNENFDVKTKSGISFNDVTIEFVDGKMNYVTIVVGWDDSTPDKFTFTKTSVITIDYKTSGKKIRYEVFGNTIVFGVVKNDTITHTFTDSMPGDNDLSFVAIYKKVAASA